MTIKCMTLICYACGFVTMIMMGIMWNSVHRRYSPHAIQRKNLSNHESHVPIKIIKQPLYLPRQGPTRTRRTRRRRRRRRRRLFRLQSETSRTSPRRKIDMVNEYFPFVNFSLNQPVVVPSLTNVQKESFLVVFVVSAAKGGDPRQRRAIIRKTWGSHATCEQRRMARNGKLSKLKWLLVFVVTKAGPGTDDDERNEAEAKHYNDMLIGNMPDNYVNLILKVYMALQWVASLPSVKYVVKADDDVHLRIPKLIKYFADTGYPKHFYGGYARVRKVLRDPYGRDGKWAVSWKYYPHKLYPNYNAGPCYVLSTDLLTHLLSYVLVRKPFHIEDAYIGMAINDGHFNVTNMEPFLLEENPKYILRRSDCKALRSITVGHRIGWKAIETYHTRIERLCERNVTLWSCS